MIAIKDLTFSQYFTILEMLSKNEYGTTKNKRGVLVPNRTPLPKEKRTEAFMFELHRGIVKQMCNLGVEYLEDDTFVVLCWDLIAEKLEEINRLIAYDAIEDVPETFDFKGSKLAYLNFGEWTFNKWVTLENASKGTSKTEGNEQIILEHGAKFLLPICFGEWSDKMPDFKEKYDYFNNQLLAKDIALVWAKVNNQINALKSAHYPMYSSDGSDNSTGAYKSHVDIFGWQETLKNIAEKGVFGDYLELKGAPLLQVLEYLNCSVSAELAKEKDFEANKKLS